VPMHCFATIPELGSVAYVIGLVVLPIDDIPEISSSPFAVVTTRSKR
jgi:hypothetical protein